MILHLRRSLLLSAIFLVLFGLAYPLAGTGLAQAFFGHQANGSLTSNGSSLIGQTWTGPKWFQGRPDGTVLTNKSGQVVVSGTNQPGPLSASLAKSVAQQAEVLKQEGIIPTNDLVTTSGSLVDPDISPNDGFAQVDAVAAARGVPSVTVRKLVASYVHSRELGFLGAPYIDVLELNDALSKLG